MEASRDGIGPQAMVGVLAAVLACEAALELALAPADSARSATALPHEYRRPRGGGD